MTRIDPLTWNKRIVDEQGRPTPEFLTQWNKQFAINANIPDQPGGATTFLRADGQYTQVDETGLSLSDIATGNVTTARHGFIPKLPNNANVFFNGAGAYTAVSEDGLSLSDVTTGNATTGRHGFVKKLSGTATQFLNGQGDWATPAGGGSGTTELTITNPGAETGDMTGWTNVGGGFTSELANPSGHTATPIEGSRMFLASSNSFPGAYQDISASAFSSEIAAQSVVLDFMGWGVHTFSDDDYAYLTVQFLDSMSNVLAESASSTNQVNWGTGRWYSMRVVSQIPTSTATFRLHMWADRNSGSNNNAAIDALRCFVRAITNL